MALIPKISFPIPANGRGKAFANPEELLGLVNGESSGLYLVGSQGMWHGGIHITDATAPWCALTGTNESELAYVNTPYPGEQAVCCMADGEVVAWRVCKDYEFIEWRGGKVYFSTSFLLVRHYIQPGENAGSGLTFHTLYMNLAPVSAYGQTDASLRQTAKGQSYYTSQDAVNAGTASGTLAVDTQVKLGAVVMTSTHHHRQFCEVTVVNGAGSLNAGDKVWTVSDRGWLKPLSGQAKVPSWWAKCSPAYHAGTGGLQGYKTGAALKAYLSAEDVSAGKDCGKLSADFPVAVDSGIPAFTRTTDNRVFSLVTLGRDNNELKSGDRVWVVSDNDNLVAVSAPSAGTEKYGEVVVPQTPVGISAGDSIGHLGFYELPEENGKHSRYQVHIECLSADSKLPAFLTNPDHVGETAPAYLSYSEGAALFMPDAQGRMVDTTRKSRAPGILTRSKVPGVDAGGQTLAENLNAAYYQVRPEGGWMAAASVKKVAQYDLASLGFITLDKAPESFDLIDGIHHPDNVVKGILSQLCTAAQNETDSSRAMNQYNYERLLKQIDTNNDGQYSEQEYLQAVHNPTYRDHLYRIIVKHPSEWYYGKDDVYWQTYLDTLKDDPSLVAWKTYTESFIEKMKWMKQVAGMVGEPWHMHPILFLSYFTSAKCDCEQLYADKFKVAKYGEQYGPVYWGATGLSAYSRWDNLISSGEISADEKTILIAMSQNEGNMDAIQSYDSEVITAGAMQKTVKDTEGLEGKGELSTQFAKFRDKWPELYQQYAVSCGWSVEGGGSNAVIYYTDVTLTNGGKITSTPLKNLIRQGCNEQTYRQVVHNKPLAALLKVMLQPEYLDIQIVDFVERLHSAEGKVVSSSGMKICDYVKSNFGRAVVLDHSVNRPGFVVPDFKKALDNFHVNNPSISLEPATWGSSHSANESKLLDEYKLTRRMTDSTARFNALKTRL